MSLSVFPLIGVITELNYADSSIKRLRELQENKTLHGVMEKENAM